MSPTRLIVPRRFVVFGVKLRHFIPEFYSVMNLTGERIVYKRGASTSWSEKRRLSWLILTTWVAWKVKQFMNSTIKCGYYKKTEEFNATKLFLFFLTENVDNSSNTYTLQNWTLNFKSRLKGSQGKTQTSNLSSQPIPSKLKLQTYLKHSFWTSKLSLQPQLVNKPGVKE